MTNEVPKIVNQAAWNVGILVQRLAGEYYTHMAALHVAADPKAVALAPPIEPGQNVSVLRVPRGDGTDHIFDFNHFLSQVRTPEMAEDFRRAWLASTLLTVGDKLGDHGYYNKAPGAEPEAELVRHLRNGIAHKNRFSFHKNLVDPKSGQLKLPAHNRRYARALNMREYAVDTHLRGTGVLFDYGGPAVILDILTALGWHLTRTAYGFAVGSA